MIPNNNFSVLPWYSSKADQNAQRWWVYGRVYPLYTPAGFMPTFQLYTEQSNYLLYLAVINENTGAVVKKIYPADLATYGITREYFGDMMILSYPAIIPILNSMENGRY